MLRLLLITLMTLSPLLSQEVKPLIQEIGDDQLRIGKITLNKNTREISFQAGINMNEGIIEYVLVLTQGKVHEALFLTDISPTNLNIALKLLRYQESPELFEIMDEDFNFTGKFPKVPEEQKKAARIAIEVTWKKEDTSHTVPLNELILHATTEKSMPPGPWLYTGSYLHEGRYKADIAGDIIAILTSQPAMINYLGKDRENDEVWLPHKKRLPEIESVVTITIKPHSPEKS